MRLAPQIALAAFAVTLAALTGMPQPGHAQTKAKAKAPAAKAAAAEETKLDPDHLDNKVIHSSPEILDKLRKINAKGVAVLAFRIQRDATLPPSFDVSALNYQLSDLVSGAIIATNDPAAPILLANDPARTMAKGGIKSWFKEAESREKLFALDYAPMFKAKNSGPTMKVDTFLTGLLAVAADRKTATLKIEYFRAGDKEFKELISLPVVVDRDLLGSLGYRFALASRGAKRRSGEEADDLVRKGTAAGAFEGMTEAGAESVANPDGNEPAAPAPELVAPTPQNISNVRFSFLADGKLQPWKADGSSKEILLDPPTPGQKITLLLENTNDFKVGVLICMNGKNIIDMMDNEKRKFVLAPKKKYLVKGAIIKEGDAPKLADFKVLTDEEDKVFLDSASEMQIKAGVIEVSVYGGATEADVESVLPISRGLRPTCRSLPDSKEPVSLEKLQQAVSKKMYIKNDRPIGPSGRRIVAPDKKSLSDLKMSEEDFPSNPEFLAGLTLRIPLQDKPAESTAP